MGHPKALLTYRGRTFLQSILDACEALGIMRVVVLGSQAERVLETHELRGIAILRNDEMAAGPIGSIRAGIRTLRPHPVSGLVVWPVDFPHVSVDAVQALVDRFREGGASVVVPTYRGRRGHPVLFGRAVFEELMNAPDSEGARAVVRADPERVFEVPVDDPAVIDKLNTPDAYQDLVRRQDELRR